MYTNILYLGREWNVDHDQRARVSNAELRYAVLGSGEPAEPSFLSDPVAVAEDAYACVKKHPMG